MAGYRLEFRLVMLEILLKTKDALTRHLDLDEFISNYVEQQNSSISEHNRKVEEMINSYQDLFS
jgi:hypothetical protein